MIPTFLKWAGGKRRLIEQIDPHLPKRIYNYFEPFLGGGAIFFYIKQKYNPKFCMISDINKDLIKTYKSVRNNPKALMKYLKYFKRKNSEEFFYKIRKKFNENKIRGIRRSAAFVYLNKTCYNGLYRVNSKGEFNVPYGRYKNPEIFNKEILLFASKLLKDVKIKHQDYENIKKYIKKDSFVYLDPCYDPLKKTSFANYTPKRFSDEENVRLSLFVKKINKKKGSILLSNNVTDNVKKLYPESEGFKQNIVYCSRSINSNPFGRSFIQEFLISNYNKGGFEDALCYKSGMS